MSEARDGGVRDFLIKEALPADRRVEQAGLHFDKVIGKYFVPRNKLGSEAYDGNLSKDGVEEVFSEALRMFGEVGKAIVDDPGVMRDKIWGFRGKDKRRRYAMKMAMEDRPNLTALFERALEEVRGSMKSTGNAEEATELVLSYVGDVKGTRKRKHDLGVGGLAVEERLDNFGEFVRENVGNWSRKNESSGKSLERQMDQEKKE